MSFLNNKKKDNISEFVKFVRNELKMKEYPVIILQNGRGDLKTTASYDYSNDKKIIRVNSKNRALVDVLRSIAHEMVHHKQFEDGRLKIKPADIGSEEENEANYVAGIMIKKYALNNQNIYDDVL